MIGSAPAPDGPQRGDTVPGRPARRRRRSGARGPRWRGSSGLLDGGGDPTASGGLVVLAVPTVAVAVLAQAVATDRLVVSFRPIR